MSPLEVMARELLESLTVYNKTENFHDYTADTKAITEAFAAVAKGAKPKWIPTSERLPELGARVLFLAHSRIGYRVRCFGKRGPYNHDEWCDESNCDADGDPARYSTSEVTHWQPQPEWPSE